MEVLDCTWHFDALLALFKPSLAKASIIWRRILQNTGQKGKRNPRENTREDGENESNVGAGDGVDGDECK